MYIYSRTYRNSDSEDTNSSISGFVPLVCYLTLPSYRRLVARDGFSENERWENAELTVYSGETKKSNAFFFSSLASTLALYLAVH